MGQHGLFGVFAEEERQQVEKPLPNIPDWDEHQRLSAEKEILGFFITGHPLEKYREKLLDFQRADHGRRRRNEVVNRKGRGSGWRNPQGHSHRQVEEGRPLRAGAAGRHERLGRHSVSLPKPIERLSEKLKLDVPVLVKGGVRVEEGSNPKLMISDITPLEEAQPKLPRSLAHQDSAGNASPRHDRRTHTICAERKGEAKVLFDLERKGDFTVVMEAEGYNVLPDRSFINRVEELCGRGSVSVSMDKRGFKHALAAGSDERTRPDKLMR